MSRCRRKIILVASLGTVALVVLVAGIIVWQVVDWSDSPEDEYYVSPSHSEVGVFQHAAVATDAPYCSDIGVDILKRNGTVADAAIATALCVGVIQSQSMGLGGGFLLVYYDAASKTARTLNARERAPAKATEDMFKGDPDTSSRGPLAVAVPGELKGYWELYKKYGGNLRWSELFAPTIKLAKEGFNLTAHAANALRQNSNMIRALPAMSEVFVSNITHDVFKVGDTIRRPTLAATLEEIAKAGDRDEGDLLYRNSDLMRKFIHDLRYEGGILEEQDMLDYKVSWDDPVEMDMAGGFKVHSIPPPGSGLLLGFMMKALSNFTMKDESVVNFQRLVEIYKHAYAKRTLLGDPQSAEEEVRKEVEELRSNLTSTDYINEILKLVHDNSTNNTHEYYGAEFYQPEDHGTAHLNIIAPNGDAIAFTSTVNLYFGSMVRSQQTGIIYNDQMDDFASPNITNQFGVPPSKNNFIEPHKRPVSSMTPAIFTDDQGKVRLVVGGSGGTKITTAVASVAIRNLWFGQTIKESIDARRIHHQLYPMQLQYEEGFNQNIIDGLSSFGHDTESFALGTSVIQGIAVAENGTIYANSDFRKVGTVAGI